MGHNTHIFIGQVTPETSQTKLTNPKQSSLFPIESLNYANLFSVSLFLNVCLMITEL